MEQNELNDSNIAENVVISELEPENEDISLENAKILKVGDKFSSFQSFELKLKEYERQVLNNYWIRDGKTINNRTSNCPKGRIAFKAKEELKYISVRARLSSYHVPACGQYLEIKELKEEHNHLVNEALFKSVTNQRLDLPEEVRDACQEALKMRGNKKIIQNKVIAETGCLVTLKDLSNMRLQDNASKEKKDFEACMNELEKTYGCDVEINCDSENNLLAFYFQDKIMKQMFSAFPEIIFVDGTYSLHSSRASTYVIMVEDSDGNASVAAVGVLLNETDENLDWFIRTFKNINTESTKVKIVVSDKDATERGAFKRNFPDAKFLICLFHVMQIFNREVSPKNMKIPIEKCEIAKDYLQKLAYSKSEDDFEKLEKEMKEKVALEVLEYYNKNWAGVKEEWVMCYTFSNPTFLNRTNNRLENLNKHLKSVIERYSNLDEFIKKFFVVINSTRTNQNVNSSKMLNKISTTKFPENSLERLYQEVLTSHAFEKVLQQLNRIDCCKECLNLSEDKFLLETSEGLLTITPYSCECLFWKSMGLPCRHIFKVRSVTNNNLFEPSLCLRRWTKNFFLQNHPFYQEEVSFDELDNNGSIQVSTTETVAKKRVLTNHEKFKMMNQECLKLSQLNAEVSSELFYSRLEHIKKLYRNWSSSSGHELDDPNQYEDFSDEEEHVVAEHLRDGEEEVLAVNNTSSNKENVSVALIEHNYDKENITALSKIKVAPLTKPRGRPKNLGKTVIGLERKKNKKKPTKRQHLKALENLTAATIKKRKAAVVLGENASFNE